MKVAFAFPAKKGRIEIIPLIDIVFFLLASFKNWKRKGVREKKRCQAVIMCNVVDAVVRRRLIRVVLWVHKLRMQYPLGAILPR